MKARSGGGHRPGFEGGQMPLYRRLPKRGFNNVNRIDYAVVNLRDIEALEGSTLGLAEFKAQGVLRSNAPLLKVLATGEITRAVTVSAHRFSEAAKQKILAAGGKVIELAVKATKAE
jgi:large subunit ribosomal protein L15